MPLSDLPKQNHLLLDAHDKLIATIIGMLLFLSMFCTQAVSLSSVTEVSFSEISYASRIAKLSNGSLIAFYGNDSITILSRISNDNGQTWSLPHLVRRFVALAACLMIENKLMLFYEKWVAFDRINQVFICSLWQIESYDDGITWSNECRIDQRKHTYTLGSYGLVRMRNGTIIYPISWYDGGTTAIDYWRAGILRSDDNGVNWYETQPVPNPDRMYEVCTGLDEPSVVEMSNGSLYCLFRTTDYSNLGLDSRHVASISNDYGLTWCKPFKIKNMYSGDTTPAIVRYSWSPNIILATWINRTGLGLGEWKTRYPLVVALSENDGLSWNWVKILDNPIGCSMNEMFYFINSNIITLTYRRNSGIVGEDHSAMKFFGLNFFYSMGDLDHNGVINIQDLALFEIDLNNDNVVDIYDAILLAGKIGMIV